MTSKQPSRQLLLTMANSIIASIRKTITSHDRGGKSTLYEVVGDRYIGLIEPYELAQFVASEIRSDDDEPEDTQYRYSDSGPIRCLRLGITDVNRTGIYARFAFYSGEALIVDGSPRITRRQWRQAVALLCPTANETEPPTPTAATTTAA